MSFKERTARDEKESAKIKNTGKKKQNATAELKPSLKAKIGRNTPEHGFCEMQYKL